jgi:hypothetical protein
MVLRAAMLLSLIPVAAAAAAAAKCSLPHPGIDWLNSHHQSAHPTESYEECCALCEASAACKAFTFQTQQKSCYLKGDNSGQQKNPQCISGCKGPCPPSPPAPPGPPGPAPPGPPRAPCMGEFTRCKSGECAMSSRSCGVCKPGEYVCPSDQKTCVASASAYAQCPSMKGTHLDASLDIEKRLDYLVAHTNLTEQIAQLQNTAPEIFELGIPEYQWLNDDQHGVARTPAHATVFANGVGLGDTFSHETIHAVGAVVGQEARGLHNGFLSSDPDNREMHCNGCSLTMYAPNVSGRRRRCCCWRRCRIVLLSGPAAAASNTRGPVIMAPQLNLVRDPRCKRLNPDTWPPRSSACPHHPDLCGAGSSSRSSTSLAPAPIS